MVQRISRAIQERWPKIPLYDIRGPRIMRTQEEFDNLLIPANHPQRASRKIRYLSDNRLLRSHMTPLLGRAVNIIHDQGLEQATFLMPGICYLRTLPAPERISEPHKLDIWLFQSPPISQQSESTLLEEVEVILQGIFQEKHWRSRAHPKVHPYTAPGFSIEVSLQPGLWIKMLECGQASAALLQKQGIDPRQFRVSAFGLGLERCVMAVKELNDIRLLRHPSLILPPFFRHREEKP
ncbi:tRNA ligase subunit PheS family protein [unidentified bacterial endosymbiont]|uniref:tRNA ligase subunit PheS family protein n=1 Tax=unidentified bacterial endosymbiont TaxID=2355 RepID=UPI00209F7348|nr:hypothetical protein [unidentified bacterial endosymbiont]